MNAEVAFVVVTVSLSCLNAWGIWTAFRQRDRARALAQQAACDADKARFEASAYVAFLREQGWQAHASWEARDGGAGHLTLNFTKQVPLPATDERVVH